MAERADPGMTETVTVKVEPDTSEFEAALDRLARMFDDIADSLRRALDDLHEGEDPNPDPPATFAASPMRECQEHDRSEAECRRLALEGFGQPAFDNCEFAGSPAHTESDRGEVS